MKQFQIPIVFLVYNRPELTKKVANQVKLINPKKIYVIADGPKNQTDQLKCQKVRKIFDESKWDSKIVKIFREENLGCKQSVARGIDLVFENESKAIFLEDDCLPDLSFFGFCEQMLNTHQNNSKIMHISGNNFWKQNDFEHSYEFSRIPHIWGWATWKRAWQKYDVTISDYAINKLKHSFPKLINRLTLDYYLHKVKIGKIDTWDFQWTYAIAKQNGLSITPKINLVQNIGFGTDSTHTSKSDSLVEIPAQKLISPYSHPKKTAVSTTYDDFLLKTVFQSEWNIYIKKTIQRNYYQLLHKLVTLIKK